MSRKTEISYCYIVTLLHCYNVTDCTTLEKSNGLVL